MVTLKKHQLYYLRNKIQKLIDDREVKDVNEEERIIGAESSEEDETIELSLRPQLLAQYIGQDKVKSEMKIYIKAAKRGQKQHSSGTKITAAMEGIDCGRSITETKRGVEVS